MLVVVGPEVSPSRLPVASLPRVPARLSPVAAPPRRRGACAVPIARLLRAAAMLRPLLIHRALSDGYRRLKAAVACCSDAALVGYFILQSAGPGGDGREPPSSSKVLTDYET